MLKCLKRGRAIGWLAATALLPSLGQAVPVTGAFNANVESIGEYEYGTAQPIPQGSTPLLPLLAGATRVVGTYSYDTATAIDLNPSPTVGQFVVPGSFTLALPELGMSVTSSGNLGLGTGSGGFQVNGNSIVGYSGDFGGAVPFSISVVLYGTGIAGDALPTSAPPWQVINAYFDVDGVKPPRDFFILARPVPEPATIGTLVIGLCMVGLVARRFRRLEPHPS